MPRVSAVLLAAGESTRMGRQKALMPWQGATLLHYQLEQLSAVDEIDEIIVVTGHQPAQLTAVAATFPKARVAHNPAYRTGKVSSITTGLAAISGGAGALLLLGVDQPRPAGLLRHLVAEHEATHALITVPSRGGHRGHPPIFDKTLFPELARIDEATQGIRAVMQLHAGGVREVEVEDAVALLDLNTAADVAAWESERRT